MSSRTVRQSVFAFTSTSSPSSGWPRCPRAMSMITTTEATSRIAPTKYGKNRGPSTLADPGGTLMNPAPMMA